MERLRHRALRSPGKVQVALGWRGGVVSSDSNHVYF